MVVSRPLCVSRLFGTVCPAVAPYKIVRMACVLYRPPDRVTDSSSTETSASTPKVPHNSTPPSCPGIYCCPFPIGSLAPFAPNKCTTAPSSVVKLHSSVSKYPSRLLRTLTNLTKPFPFVPLTQKLISMCPCNWFNSPLIHGTLLLK